MFERTVRGSLAGGLGLLIAAWLLASIPVGQAHQASPDAGPVVSIETVKGTIEFETYPQEAPKSVEHVLALVKRGFYNGHRVHRVVPGALIQFGDPWSRDMTRQASWGRGPGSGRAVGVLEASPKRPHKRGSVSLAHPNDPTLGDAQIFIMLQAQPKYDGGYTVFGQVVSGMDVVAKLEETDIIRRVVVKAEGPS